MITNEEKIEIITNKLNTLEFIIQSYIDHAEEFQNKYSLDHVLIDCNAQKEALIKELEDLGGIWQ